MTGARRAAGMPGIGPDCQGQRRAGRQGEFSEFMENKQKLTAMGVRETGYAENRIQRCSEAMAQKHMTSWRIRLENKTN